MWWLILHLGICALHWTKGTEVQRGTYNLNITHTFGIPKTLLDARCIPYSMSSFEFCMADPTLDLSNLELEAIAKHALDHLTFVENLNLGNNKLETFPTRIFSRMKNLETLSLANNNIQHLHVNFGGLSKLKSINLSNNKIKSLKNLHRLNVTKYADIIMEGNDLKLLKIKRKHGKSGDRSVISAFPTRSPTTSETILTNTEETQSISEEIPFPWEVSDLEPFSAILCKIEASIVTAVSLAITERSIGECSRIYVGAEPNVLSVYYLGLTAFRRGWYKIRSNYFSTLDLARNRIHEITPELLNDLPESILYVSLVKNSIGIIRKNVIENRYLISLTLKENWISTIEDGAFQKTNLHELCLNMNNLEDLDFVRTLPTSIKRLQLHSNAISNVSMDPFVNLKNLEYLNLSANRIIHLYKHVFRSLNKLHTLDLNSNGLRTIESGTFELENLFHLELSFNRIEELDAGTFKNLKKLSSISLLYNRIERIKRDTFSGMRNSIITMFNLRSNRINTIEEGSFAYMKIDTLQLADNELSEQSIAKGAFASATLSNLDLSYNMFSSIDRDSFYGILIYNELSLRQNNITSIKKGDAEYMGCPAQITLKENEVERIENGAFYEFQKCNSVTIRLSGVKSIQGGIFDDV